MHVWINGSLTDIHSAKVSIFSHSFSRGTAIFEVLEIVTNKNGKALLGIHQHLQRFRKSAEEININVPYSNEEIIAATIACAQHNNVANGLVKFFAYFDDFEFSVMPHNPKVSFALLCIDYKELSLNIEELSKPSKAHISSYKKLDPCTVPVHAKVAGNYVNSYLAQLEATQKGFTDAILIDTKGNIAEAATANIFFVKDKNLYTPTLRSIMPGITRTIVLDIAKHNNIYTSECDIPVESINQYSEAFFSGSVNNIQPIASIDTIRFEPVPGAISQLIHEQINNLLNDDHPLAYKYLYYL